MGRKKKSDLATAEGCDWTFLEIPDMPEHLRRIADRAAGQFGLDKDDMYQELVLFMAVRPDRMVKSISRGGLGLALHRAWLDAYTLASRFRKGADVEEPTDDLLFFEEVA